MSSVYNVYTNAGFLANVLSPACLSSDCNVRATQPVEIFSNVSTPFGTLANGHPLTFTKNVTEIVPASIGGRD